MSLIKVHLRDVLDVKRGASLSGEYYSESGKYIRLTLGNFNYPNGGFKENTSKKDIYFTGDIKSEFILKKGDIITPLTEQVSGLLGETARIPEDNKYIQSGDVGLIIPNESKLNKDFAYYLISSSIIRKQLDASSQQTKIRHTSPEYIRNCLAWIPNEIKTQKDIANILDCINSKIEINNQSILELESLIKTIYNYWFLQFEFPDENGKPYKSSGGIMEWNEELKREIPNGWGIGTIADFGEIIAGGTPDTSIDEYYSPNGIAWITPNDLSETTDMYISHGERDISELGLRNSSAKLIPKGSVLLSTRAPIGYCVISLNELTTNQGFKSIVPNDEYSSEYVYYTLKSLVKSFVNQAGQTTFKEISKNTLSTFLVLLPNKKILKRYNRLINPISEKRKMLEQENRELISLRDFILPMLMNGQINIIEA